MFFLILYIFMYMYSIKVLLDFVISFESSPCLYIKHFHIYIEIAET